MRASVPMMVLIILTSSLAGCSGTDTSDLELQIEELQQNQFDANQTIQELAQSNSELSSQLSSMQQSLDSLSNELNETRSQLIEQINSVNETINWAYLSLGDVNLSGVDLSGANLTYIKLESADLSGTDLSYVDMTFANLMNANLEGANLEGVDLSNADLRGANLTGADLSGTTLDGADLRGIDLTGVNLSSVSLVYPRSTYIRGCPDSMPMGWHCITYIVSPNYHPYFKTIFAGPTADLSDTQLGKANLSGIDLSDASLTNVEAYYLSACPALLPENWGCIEGILIGPTARIGYWTDDYFPPFIVKNLSGADLSGVDLTNSRIHDINLSNANLYNANLSNAYITSSNLSNAYLYNANLSGASLPSSNDLTNVVWTNTICPDGTNSDDNGDTCENNL